MAKRFDKRDFDLIADYVVSEWKRRKEKRSDLEKAWKDIDRQLRMEPDVSHKLDANGKPDDKRAWMPETELPLQSQTLEVLTADARRMRFPDSGPWFAPHAAMEDKYLDKVELSSIITGDENDVPSLLDQDNIDKLVLGTMNHWHRQYDFQGNVDLIDAEAFKYGMGVGRGRVVQKRVFHTTSKGVVKQDQKIPALFPVSIKNVYPDDREHVLMNEGHVLSPATIHEKTQAFEDLKIAANKGSTDPQNENGGWMPANLKKVHPDKEGNVKVIEYEGDLIVPRKTTDSIYIPNALVTIVVGGKDKASGSVEAVVRMRLRKTNASSYIFFPYHREALDTPYAASPLMKGWPIQKAAVDALNRLIMVGALNAQPPVSYDGDDSKLVQRGGPLIYPGATWPTLGKIDVHNNFGEPSALFAIYAGLLNQYADVTGINAPRLGAQTVSHTTAFAKEAEISRGTIRTVDYIKSTLQGPMAQWLSMEYELGRNIMKKDTIYIDAYNGFVDVDKDVLPERVTFEVFGSGGPAEEQAKVDRKLNSINTAIQIDQMKLQAQQLGANPTINLDEAIKQVLRDGGWTDVDVLLTEQPPVQVGEGTIAPGAALVGLENV